MSKSCSIAVIGQPNAGKSSFLNYLMQSKLVAVSHKRNTTIQNIWGTFILHNVEFLIIDTPGWQKDAKEYRLNALCASAIHQADITILLIDGAKSNIDALDLQILEAYPKIIPIFSKRDIAINLGEKLIVFCDKTSFCISSKTGYGIYELFEYLGNLYSVERDWLNVSSSIDLGQVAAERTREYIFKYLHQEVPYCLKVETTEFKFQNNEYFIKQNIITPDKRYIHIIIGSKGSQLKQIGTSTRLDLQNIWKKPVHLNIKVL